MRCNTACYQYSLVANSYGESSFNVSHLRVIPKKIGIGTLWLVVSFTAYRLEHS